MAEATGIYRLDVIAVDKSGLDRSSGWLHVRGIPSSDGELVASGRRSNCSFDETFLSRSTAREVASRSCTQSCANRNDQKESLAVALLRGAFVLQGEWK